MKDFEARLKRLEEICATMSTETLPLSEGLALYEEGVRLVKQLEEELTSAERKVERLTNDDLSDKGSAPRLQLFEERDAEE